MMGIGGTGVVTINQLLATAALLDGKESHGLDQTGLAQKGGPVVSNLKIRWAGAEGEVEEANKIGSGEADAYIVFDLLTGTSPANLEKAMPGKTIALVSSSKVPTGAMVRDTSAKYPEWSTLQATIDSATVPEKNIYFDAGRLSDALFRSHMPANIIVLGSAYQSGVIPISASAIEKAIELNGVSIDNNIQAFRIGRKIVLDSTFLDSLNLGDKDAKRMQNKSSATAEKMIKEVQDPSEELQRLLSIRTPELIDYQNVGYAQTYIDFVSKVRKQEISIGSDTRMSETVARYLFKLMAYKDEYEVARLHRSGDFHQAIKDQFGDKTKVTYKLHPPSMKKLGLDKKIGLGKSGDVAFAVLTKMKFLRGKGIDPFGNTRHRKLERALIPEYMETIDSCLQRLSSDNYENAIEIAALPDMIRGYEEIKEANVERYREAVQNLL